MNGKRNGFALLSVFFLAGIFAALIVVYQVVTKLQLRAVTSYNFLNKGMYSTESALNYRIFQIKSLSNGYYSLQGTPVDETLPRPCLDPDNSGSGDFACQTHTFNDQTVYTYVVPYAEPPADPNNLKLLQTPFGDKFQHLSGYSFYYKVKALAINPETEEVKYSQANLIEVKNIPLFHFAAFYNKDLEISFNRATRISGPLHTNFDLYLDNAFEHLRIGGQVTAGGEIYRGRKDGSTPSCHPFSVSVKDPITPLLLIPNCAERTLVTQQDLNPFKGAVRRKVPAVVTPPVDRILGSGPGNFYFENADLRLILNGFTPVLLDADNDVSPYNDQLRACPGSIGGFVYGVSYFYPRNVPSAFIATCVRVFDIDLGGLFDCLQNTNWFAPVNFKFKH